MRVALITPFNPETTFGGVERFVNELKRSLVDRGMEVDVFHSNLHVPGFFKIVPFLSLVSQRINFKNYDIIHAQGWIGSLSLLKGDTPFLTTLHGTTFGATKATEKFCPWYRNLYHYFVGSTMEKIACKNSNAVVCVSKQVENEAKEYYNLDAAKSRVIYNGVDIDFFKPSKEPKLDICLAVGRIDIRKGLDFLEIVAKNIKSKVLIAGSTAYHVSLPVKKFSYSELPKVYNSAKLFLQTSRYEGCSFALLEAMACGLPVVSFDEGSTKEIVRDGKDGFIVKLGDTKEMINKVNLLLEDEKLRKKMGKNARKRAEQFTLKKVADEYINLYKSLL